MIDETDYEIHVARAIHDTPAPGIVFPGEFDDIPPLYRESMLLMARNAIAAMRERVVITRPYDSSVDSLKQTLLPDFLWP